MDFKIGLLHVYPTDMTYTLSVIRQQSNPPYFTIQQTMS